MQPERIEFPTDYPIKVVIRADQGLRARVEEVFCRHFGPRAPEGLTERHSAQGHFVSLTYTPRVEHEDQLRGLHAELSAIEGVMMVI